MRILFPKTAVPVLPCSSPSWRLAATVLGLLAAVPGLASMRSMPVKFGTMVRESAWIVRVRPAKPASVAKTAIDPETGWKTAYDAQRMEVLEVLAKPSGGKAPQRLLVVDRNLQTFEDLGSRAATKILLSSSFEPLEEERCRDGGEWILFLGVPNGRGEYPETFSGACLSAKSRGRIDGFLAGIARNTGRRDRTCGTSGVCTDGLEYRSEWKFSVRTVEVVPEARNGQRGVLEMFREGQEAFERTGGRSRDGDDGRPRLLRLKVRWGVEGKVEACSLDSGTTGAAELDSALIGNVRAMRWESARWGVLDAPLEATVLMELELERPLSGFLRAGPSEGMDIESEPVRGGGKRRKRQGP